MSFYDDEDDDIDNLDEYDSNEYDDDDGLSDEVKDKVKEKVKEKFNEKYGDSNSAKNESLNKFNDSLSNRSSELANKEATNAASKAATDGASKAAAEGATQAATTTGTTAATTTGTTAATTAGTTAATTAGTTAATTAGTTAATTAGATAAGTAAGATAGSVVPVVGTIIGAIAGLLLGKIVEKIQKKKKEKEENGEGGFLGKSALGRFILKHKFLLLVIIILIIIIVIISCLVGEKAEIIDEAENLVARREKRYAKNSYVTYQIDELDEKGNKIIDENGNTKKKTIKPVLLFNQDEVNELISTTYYYEDETNPHYSDAKATFSIDGTQDPFSTITDIFRQIIDGADAENAEDKCLNQIMYATNTNEIADFVTSMGIKTDDITEDMEADLSEETHVNIATKYVKECILAQQENFNRINWKSCTNGDSYQNTGTQRFNSESDYQANDKKVSSNGNGDVINDIPKEDIGPAYNTNLSIPKISNEKYDITIGNYDNIGELGVDLSKVDQSKVKDTQAVLEYYSLTKDYLIDWIVPLALLVDTSDPIWLDKITEDLYSGIDLTLYQLQRLNKNETKEYYLKSEEYYTYDVYCTIKTDYDDNIGGDILEYLDPGSTIKIGGTYNTNGNNYPRISCNYYNDNMDTSDSSKPLGDSSASYSSLGLDKQNFYTVNSNGQYYIYTVRNVKLHRQLKYENGHAIIATDANGEPKIKSITVDRSVGTYQVVPKVTKADGMYLLEKLNYTVTKINEDNGPSSTSVYPSNNYPLVENGATTGTITTTYTYDEHIFDAGSTKAKEYQLSYISPEKQENMSRRISRIEWIQDCGRVSSIASSGEAMSTSEITDTIWEFFMDKGLPEVTAAAIMGNIQQESGFRLDAISYDGNGSIGLCQWTWGRRTALQNMAASMGLEETDLEAQLAYLWDEIKDGRQFNGYNGSITTLEQLIAIDDIELATEQFCWSFERPGVPRMEARVQYANNWYTTYAGSYEPSQNAENSQNNQGNSNNDQNSQGNNSQNNTNEQQNSADILEVAKEIHDKYNYCVYSQKGTQIPFAEDEPSYDCSSYVSFVLYSCGFEEEMKGHQHTASTLKVWCEQKGWEKITNISDLQPGDILFYANGSNGGIGHVDLFYEDANDPYTYVYSGGSTNSIRSNGPSMQSLTSMKFYCGYRPEGVTAGGTSSGKYLFGEGNIYEMYPTKLKSQKVDAYNKYIGTREGNDGQEYPKGYVYEDLTFAFEYIEKAYKSSDKQNAATSELVDPDTMTGVSSYGFIHPVLAQYSAITTGLYYSDGDYHGAVDFGSANINGSPVLAVKDGTVIVSQALKSGSSYYSYGEYVIIDHHDGTYTLYAHMQPDSRLVNVGDEVKQGQQIGVVGTTGNSTGPHLHFEVRTGSGGYNNRTDPRPYLLN